MQVINEKAQAESPPARPEFGREMYPAGHPYAATLTDQRNARNFFIFNCFIAEPVVAPGICSQAAFTLDQADAWI